MPRRLWLSSAMLATGAALLVAAQLAGAASDERGGIFKVGTTGASVQIDPQLSYISMAWALEYATAAKLYEYTPRGKLVPEVASTFTVSNGGRQYTFFIRKGFRFSDGTAVTASSFKYAVNRVANRDLASPGAQFITDPNGVDIVGAQLVLEGQATDVSGVRVRSGRLIIDLTRPTGKLLSILTMPFFQATSTRLPLDREVSDVRSMADLPSAGPYAFALNDVNRLTELRRNPYWTRGPGRIAPRNLDGVDIQWNLNEQLAFEMVKANQLDEGPLPAAEIQNVANQYGVNKTRFWVEPIGCIGRILLNSGSGLFQGNASMRRAVNWAIDRTDYLGGSAAYTQTPWTHLIPPGYPGSITKPKLQPYGQRANFAKARQLAAGHFKDRQVIVAYRSGGTIDPGRAEVVRRDLEQLGLNVTMSPVRDLFPPAGRWDVFVSLGWCMDSADPSEFLSILWKSREPWWPPNTSKYDVKIAHANALTGQARLRAFGRLDLEIMKNLAPVVVTNTYNNRYFFSNRVDPRSLVYHHVYQDWSIPALALK